jgi:hypothetical protein
MGDGFIGVVEMAASRFSRPRAAGKQIASGNARRAAGATTMAMKKTP